MYRRTANEPFALNALVVLCGVNLHDCAAHRRVQDGVQEGGPGDVDRRRLSTAVA